MRSVAAAGVLTHWVLPCLAVAFQDAVVVLVAVC